MVWCGRHRRRACPPPCRAHCAHSGKAFEFCFALQCIDELLQLGGHVELAPTPEVKGDEPCVEHAVVRAEAMQPKGRERLWR